MDGRSDHPDATARGRRRADLARIHVAKANLGLDDAAYRAILHGLAGVTSAAELDARGRARVIAAFRLWGALPSRRGGGSAAAPGMPTPSRPGHVGKLRAVWRRMHAAGIVRDGSPEALDRFVEHRTGVAGVNRLTGAQAARVIAVLEAWRKRARERRTGPAPRGGGEG